MTLTFGESMKNLNLIFASFLAFTIFSPQAFSAAKKGNEGSGGGDICENRIKNIRDDLSEWIRNGGPNNLKFSEGVNASQYSYAMLDQIERAKVKCVGKGDVGYPVKVNETPKVCRFDAVNEGSITCDFTKFQETSESDQYVLIHHEYAGLAKLENPNGADSTYALSNQISNYLVNQVIRKLSVNAPVISSIDEKLQMNFLPKGTLITIPLNTVINSTVVDLELGSLRDNENRSIKCKIGINPSYDLRKVQGILVLKISSAEFTGESYIINLQETPKISKNPLNTLKNAVNCENSNSYGAKWTINIKSFRKFIDSIGGTLSIPNPVEF